MSADTFARRGYIILSGTAPINLAAKPIFGLTPLGGPCTLAAITHPVSNRVPGSTPVTYQGDAALIGKSLAEGVFYPFPATAVTLTTGAAIGWLA